jgi:predicted transcriptional regulator
MRKLLLQLLLIALIGYFVLDYFFPDKDLKQVTGEVSEKAGRWISRADSLARMTYHDLKDDQLDSLEQSLSRLEERWKSTEDTADVRIRQDIEQLKLKKEELNLKLMELDTVAKERYDQVKNKLELGIKLLEEKIHSLEKE